MQSVWIGINVNCALHDNVMQAKGLDKVYLDGQTGPIKKINLSRQTSLLIFIINDLFN